MNFTQTYVRLGRLFPVLRAMQVPCPTEEDEICFHQSPRGPRCSSIGSVLDIVVHLNDHHRWSRERIADWIEGLDLKLEFPTPKELPKRT